MPTEPIRKRAARASLPKRAAAGDDGGGMTHDELITALRSVEGLRDTGKGHPNFQFRSRAFLHFHASADGRVYADVRLGTGDFEPVWASTPAERGALLALVCDHVERIQRARQQGSHPRR